MTGFIDLTGNRYMRLLVISRAENSKNWQTNWVCDCDCGKRIVVRAASLRKGQTRSCGCYMRMRTSQANSTHGKSKTPEHNIWCGMLARCLNPHRKSFKDYGARGIKVCDRWRNSFADFLADVGPRPSPKHSLERNDSNGHYEPGNVVWATPIVQVNNRRNTRHVIYNGKRMALTDAVRAAGSVIHREAAWIRIKTGWPVERALETPRTVESPNANSRRLRKQAEGVPA